MMSWRADTRRRCDGWWHWCAMRAPCCRTPFHTCRFPPRLEDHTQTLLGLLEDLVGLPGVDECCGAQGPYSTYSGRS
eukprot:7302849-Pyramimonas_sp.AAC.1